MKTISILKSIINVIFLVLSTIITIVVFFFLALIFFEDTLPDYVAIQRVQFFSSLYDWKIYLVKYSQYLNFILFTIAIYYLKKSIKPFANSNFYSTIIIKNFKITGNIFIFIGVSSLLIKFIATFYILDILSLKPFHFILSLISSIDLTGLFIWAIGLFLLVFSGALKHAKSLKQENDLTI